METTEQETGGVQDAPDRIDRVVEQWRHRLPSADPAPLHVLGRIQRIEALADSLLRPPLAEAGLAAGDFDVLAALRRGDDAGGLSPSALAAAMMVTRGAVTKRVDRLVEAGLVTRRAEGADARAKLVALTPQGRRLTDTLIRRHFDAEADLLSCLTAEQSTALAGLLRVLLLHVEARAGSGAPGTGGTTGVT